MASGMISNTDAVRANPRLILAPAHNIVDTGRVHQHILGFAGHGPAPLWLGKHGLKARPTVAQTRQTNTGLRPVPLVRLLTMARERPVPLIRRLHFGVYQQFGGVGFLGVHVVGGFCWRGLLSCA